MDHTGWFIKKVIIKNARWPKRPSAYVQVFILCIAGRSASAWPSNPSRQPVALP